MKWIEEAAYKIRSVACIVWDELPDGHELEGVDDKLAAVIETAYRESHPVDTDLSAVRGKLEVAIVGLYFCATAYDSETALGAKIVLEEALALMEGK